jgi:hypothetical protein
MTAEDIIADELAKEFPSASGVLSALAGKGYHLVRVQRPAPVIDMEVYRSGEMKVM